MVVRFSLLKPPFPELAKMTATVADMPQSRVSTQVSEEPASQYHHYIPRFILMNFSHPFQPRKAKGKDGSRKRFRRGETMLYTIDLTGNGDLVEAPVAKSFGLTDMYRDFRDAGNQHHLEQRLSVLESQAGEIISKMRKRHETEKPDVWMTRKQRDTLRKFLFIMKYRGMHFHKRYQHNTAEEYSENDKERFSAYMREKGFTRPIDVWFDNIKAILDLKMDPDAKWARELMKTIYPDDAKWAFTHIQAMYLALCTPSDKDDEFLLSGNLFGIHEGPVSSYIDMESGKETLGAYTEHHVFAAISPKLMMVLRSNLLPNPEEDSNEETKKNREMWYNTSLNMHGNPSRAHSILEDLPVRKANNSYTKVVDGKRVPVRGEDGSPQANHKFGFPFFPIKSDHVNKINCVILEEGHGTKTLAFRSKTAALKTLEWYLALPTGNERSYDWKVVNRPGDPKFTYIKKLEHLAHSIGSKISAAYKSMNLPQGLNIWSNILDQELQKILRENPERLGDPYFKLGML